MATKQVKKVFDKEALSRVKEEMAEPRVAYSARGQLELPVGIATTVLRFCWRLR